MTIVSITKQIAEAANTGTLPALIASRFEWLDGDELGEAITACATLHNAGEIDLLGMVHQSAFKAIAPTSFFFAQDILMTIIPSLNATPDDVLKAVDALVAQGGADMAANAPLGALSAWLKADVTHALAVVESAEAGDERATKFLHTALVAFGSLDRAREITEKFSDNRRLDAITALGELVQDEAETAKTYALFAKIHAGQNDDDVLSGALLLAVTTLADGAVGSVEEARALCASLTEAAGPHTIHFCARAIWRRKIAQTDDALVATLLKPLMGINPANKGTVRELDFALGALADAGRETQVADFIATLLGTEHCELALKEFPLFSAKLEKSAQLGATVVAWLKTGNPTLCDGVVGLLTERHDEDRALSLSADVVAMSAKEQYFVCRKAIGYFFVHPVIAASIVVSFLRAPDADAAEAIGELLFMPLLQNYGGAIRVYLEGMEKNDPAFEPVAAALAKNEEYIGGLRTAGEIKEMAPSEYQRMIEHMRRRDEAAQTFKLAREKSVLIQLVKRSTILYGRRSLSYISDGVSRRAIEMEMHPHSYSMELPRMLTIDPLGLEYLTRLYRNEEFKP